jgi:ABC-type transport system involved in multi-copper enzyme maturation permease subunit
MATSVAPHPWFQVGPHGFYDLVRLARRGRSTLVRVCYVMALFVALAVVYHNTHAMGRRDYGESINVNAHIAEQFSITILVMQNVAVLVLMPIYVAASVHEERDKRTLPLLFTTHLTAREIVRGKWLSRIGHVGGVLLGGLPVLSFVQLWGGIDMPMIAANFCNSGLWLLSVAAFSMMIATQSHTMTHSVVKTYMFLLVIIIVISCCCLPMHGELVFLLHPIGAEVYGYSGMWVVAGFLAIQHLGLTALFLNRAAQNLEAQRGDEPLAPEIQSQSESAGINGPRPSDRIQRMPALMGDALVWKERGPHSLLSLLPLLFFPYLLALFLAFSTAWTNERNWEERTMLFNDTAVLLAVMMTLSFGIYTLLVIFRLTGCIVRERERRTLESLLTLPIHRHELLIAKVKGNMLRYWLWLLPCSAAWLILVVLSGWNPLDGLCLAFAFVIHFLFFAMLGLFLSVICRSSVSAYGTMGMILLLLLIGTALASTLINPFAGSPWLTSGVNPVGCWITITNDWWRDGIQHAVPEISASLTAYALTAVAFWLVSCRRLARISSSV